ncbi:MAG: hypothetical protein NTX45_01130 [Proteobacteria bacterium]|nr:hypothetical protein [Pseudomonadota bacterium]
MRKQHREKRLYPQTLNNQDTDDDEDSGSDENSKPQVPMRN